MKADRLPADLWAMPVVHLRAAYFKATESETVSADERAMLVEQNAKAAVPFLPWWFLPEN